MSWKKVKFKEIAEVVTGSTPSTKDKDNYGHEVPFVTPVDLNNNYSTSVTTSKTYLSDKGVKLARLIPKNSVMVTCIGSLGKVGIAGREVVTNQQINSLVFTNEVLPQYGYYYCITLKNYLTQIAPATTVPIVNKSRFSNISIPLPPLDIQEKIATVLDKADQLRQKRKQSIEKLDQLLQSVFLDMFGDPVKNPKGWKSSKLNLLSKLLSGGTPSRKKPEYFEGNIPWITTVALGPKFIGMNNAMEFITDDGVKNSATKIIPKESILLGVRVGVGKASINMCDMCTNQDILSLTEIDSNINKIYMLEVFRYFEKFFNSQKRGATIQGITSETIKRLDVPLPPTELQNKFAKIVEQLERIKNRMNTNSTKKCDFFNSLLQQAFKGDLKFNDKAFKELEQTMT